MSRQLVHALASQWIGVNITPQIPEDTWVVVGIAYFITDIFMKKLSGNNEYRFRQKKNAERLVDIDVARPPLYELGMFLQLDPSELDFMALKAPLVLFILDRRLTKASGSSGLSRIISRIFLNAKVGDLPNGAITTAYFVKTCEKLGSYQNGSIHDAVGPWRWMPEIQSHPEVQQEKACGRDDNQTDARREHGGVPD